MILLTHLVSSANLPIRRFPVRLQVTDLNSPLYPNPKRPLRNYCKAGRRSSEYYPTMSDGHFDRTFLPKTDYRSAYMAGKAAARKIGEQALIDTLEDLGINPEVKDNILKLYKQKTTDR